MRRAAVGWLLLASLGALLPTMKPCFSTIPGDDLTTTTAPVFCPLISPLTRIEQVPPALTPRTRWIFPQGLTPAGTTVKIQCVDIAGGPAIVGTAAVVIYDSGPTMFIQDIDNFNGGFEEVTMFCESTGEWNVMVNTPSNPMQSGIVTAAGGRIVCRGCTSPTMPATFCQNPAG
uniref:Uncharacterized protein n=1 Tax=Plectus sambesii TaxID=2011161 RepID=A0A914VGX2_9BILA